MESSGDYVVVEREKDRVRAVCLFGSSSPRTPEAYCKAAFEVGKGLAAKGYRCVHGGGKAGVMGNITSGAQSVNGSVFGVVHSMFCVDNGEDTRLVSSKGGGLLIVGGPDLVERKQKLIDSGECLVILPGGVGTFEEMCETVSAKSLGMMGLKNKPICVVNIDGFFNGFLVQMKRAFDDGLLYGPVSSFFDLVETSEEAVEWCVKQLASSSPSNTSAAALEEARNARMITKETDSSNDKDKGKDSKLPGSGAGGNNSSSSNSNSNSSSKSFSNNSSDNSSPVFPFIVGLALGAIGMMLIRRK